MFWIRLTILECLYQFGGTFLFPFLPTVEQGKMFLGTVVDYCKIETERKTWINHQGCVDNHLIHPPVTGMRIQESKRSLSPHKSHAMRKRLHVIGSNQETKSKFIRMDRRRSRREEKTSSIKNPNSTSRSRIPDDRSMKQLVKDVDEPAGRRILDERPEETPAASRRGSRGRSGPVRYGV